MKLIELNSQQHGLVLINVDKIHIIYEADGLTKIHVDQYILDIEESIDKIKKMMYSEPIQDGMKKHIENNAKVKKNIDDLTKLWGECDV